MGFNTVVMLLNDCMHEIEKAPNGLAYLLCHPPMCKSEMENYLRKHAIEKSVEHNEPSGALYGVTVMPTFHADFTKFFRAGQNDIEACEVLRFGKTKDGKKTVTLILPDYIQKDDRYNY